MKRYQIANLAVDMDVSGRTEMQAQAYAVPVSGPADITIRCNVRRVLELFPQLSGEEAAQYVGTGMIFARKLLSFDGLFLHSSAVMLDGKAYLFSADSGTGKSTHTQKWCRLFGATYINDDKPVLRVIDGVWTAFGTPWSGKNDLSSPVGVPLGGIAFLKRGQENTIRPLAPAEALPQLMRQSMWSLEKDEMERQLSLTDALLRQIPVWELSCRDDDDAAMLSHDTMTRR